MFEPSDVLIMIFELCHVSVSDFPAHGPEAPAFCWPGVL